MKNFIVDAETTEVQRIIKRLREHEDIFDVKDGGTYGIETEYSQIWVEGVVTVVEIEDFLNEKGLDYTGVIQAGFPD
jgi:hypothetical protein